MNSHPDFLRTPEDVCSADPRSKGYSVLTEAGSRPRRLEDHHGDVVAFTLHDGVPDGIRVQFETTKNLYLYSWFVYRFYPVARHHAYTCLELALRERFEPELLAAGEKKREFGPGFKRLLSYAVEKGYLKNENFEIWRRQTEMRAWERTMHETTEEMERLGLEKMEIDESKIEIKDVDQDHDYVKVLLKTMPWLRNRHAHGTKLLDNHALGTIRLVSEIVNQIYPEK